MTFFATLADYLNSERPADATTDRVFVALKGPTAAARCRHRVSTRSHGARGRAGLSNGPARTPHTCFTRSAKQAWGSKRCKPSPVTARSIDPGLSHLGADWLADEYRRAADAIDADTTIRSAQ